MAQNGLYDCRAVAALFGVAHETARTWAYRRKIMPPPDFVDPYNHRSLWSGTTLRKWARETGRTIDESSAS